MLTTKLYNPILIKPACAGADELRIVSGYASATMALRHLDDLSELKKKVRIQLICGMTSRSGMEEANHNSFLKIQKEKFPNNFSCFYSYTDVPVHAKVYIWIREGQPFICYTGSANYTQNGFSDNLQREVMTEVCSKKGLDFYDKTYSTSIECSDEQKLIENNIHIYKNPKEHKRPNKLVLGYEEISLSLLDKRTKETHKIAGLNWGQREGRNHNQAYIPVHQEVAQSKFFPERKQYFTIETDDGFSFMAVIAQENSKAIQSTENNSIIGKYFRSRLGLDDGVYVTKKHLEEYGRTDVSFIKIDNETYYMDFSPPRDEHEKEQEESI